MKKQKSIQPYVQGDHDALCGFYAILNCLRICMADLDLSHGFYHDLLEYMVWHDRERAATYLVRGLNIADLDRAVSNAGRYVKKQLARPVVVHRPFEHSRALGSSSCIEQIAQHIGRPTRSCILALGHEHYAYHWTVAERVTPRSVLLADSCNDKSISRTGLKALSGKKATASPKSWMPRATFFLAVAEPGYVRV